MYHKITYCGELGTKMMHSIGRTVMTHDVYKSMPTKVLFTMKPPKKSSVIDRFTGYKLMFVPKSHCL